MIQDQQLNFENVINKSNKNNFRNTEMLKKDLNQNINFKEDNHKRLC